MKTYFGTFCSFKMSTQLLPSDSDSHISGINGSPSNAIGSSYTGTRLLKQ